MSDRIKAWIYLIAVGFGALTTFVALFVFDFPKPSEESQHPWISLVAIALFVFMLGWLILIWYVIAKAVWEYFQKVHTKG